jgi:signal transduction histidine kinase
LGRYPFIGRWRVVCAFLVLFAASAIQAHAGTTKRVLMLFQNDGFGYSDQKMQQSCLDALRQALGAPNLEFYAVGLDSTRHPESREQALDWVRTRYASYGIDVVIVIGNVPTEVLPGVPVVYVGNSAFSFSNQTSNRDNSTAVWYKIDLNKTVAAARQLQPKANKLLVISGKGRDDQFLLSEIHHQFAGLDIPVEYVDDATVEELLVTVAHLSPDTIVLPVSYTRDRFGKNYIPRDVVIPLAKASSAPVYSIADTYIGTGLVGGYVIDYGKTGNEIASVTLQLLSGKTTAQIVVPPGGTGTYLFDWRALQRWGLSEKNLPAGSTVVFRTPSAWELYRGRIIAVLLILAAQSFLILRLLSTRRKQAQAERSLRDMTGRLLGTQDEERRRIARDLHDGTGQHLSAVTLILGQVLTKITPGNEKVVKMLQDSHAASRQALDEVRAISFQLHPPLLDGLGLVAAVRWYLNGIEKRTELRITVQAPQEIKELSKEGERALFRIVQESVGNVLRHSGSEYVHVVLSTNHRRVTLQVSDNGTGMTEELLRQVETGASVGVGLAGMRERVRQLRGTFQLESDGTGTIVTVSLPFADASVRDV